ncbi:uncharacterized protein LOC121371631 [Gigantopelta aegis]|uniref:uncharacterized protein LOC121371631 n=1 Tax=Gigantopelta aegis TaxID=1735272 RepID=UPI001B88CF02|nr:uncharacterized protein LOC121371631 [Gigantopelta aegis]
MAQEDELQVLEHMKVLGLTLDATSDDVKKAYKRLALQYHPDKSSNDPESTRKFQEISVAYCSLIQKGVLAENGLICKLQPDKKGDNQSNVDHFGMETFKRLFLDCMAEFVVQRKDKRQTTNSFSTEEEEENQFFEFLCNNVKKNDHTPAAQENQTHLKQVDRNKQEKCSNKKQDTKKKKGKEDKKQKTPDNAGVSEIEQQLKEAKIREAELMEKLKHLEAEEKRENKKRNRHMKKAAKKHSAHGGPPHVDLLRDEFYCWSTVRNTPVKQVQDDGQVTGRKPGIIREIDKQTRDQHLEVLLLKTKKKRELEWEKSDDSTAERKMEYTSHLTQMKITESKPISCVKSVSSKPELLQQHLKAYHDLLQIQPKRHTEQQIIEERRRAKEAALIKQTIELERLRETTSTDEVDYLMYEKAREEYLRKQREMELMRNQAEALAIEQEEKENMQIQGEFIKRMRNKSEHQKHSKLMPKFENPIKRGVCSGGPGVGDGANNPWVQRASVRQLVPRSQDEEVAMIQKALELSRQTAEKEAVTRRWWESIEDEEIDKQVMEAYSENMKQYKSCDNSFLCDDTYTSNWVKKKAVSSFGGARPKLSSSTKILTFRERCNKNTHVTDEESETEVRQSSSMTDNVLNKRTSIPCSTQWDEEIAWKLEGPSFPVSSAHAATTGHLPHNTVTQSSNPRVDVGIQTVQTSTDLENVLPTEWKLEGKENAPKDKRGLPSQKAFSFTVSEDRQSNHFRSKNTHLDRESGNSNKMITSQSHISHKNMTKNKNITEENWDDCLSEVHFLDLQMNCTDPNRKLTRPEGSGRWTAGVPRAIPRSPHPHSAIDEASTAVQKMFPGNVGSVPLVHNVDNRPLKQENDGQTTIKHGDSNPLSTCKIVPLSKKSLQQPNVNNAGNTAVDSIPATGDIPQVCTTTDSNPHIYTASDRISQVCTTVGSISKVCTTTGNIPQVCTSTGNIPQVCTSTGNIPQVCTTTGNIPQVCTTTGNIPQVCTTTGNIPQVGTTTGNIPQVGTTTGNIPQVCTTTGNIPQICTTTGSIPHVCTIPIGLPPQLIPSYLHYLSQLVKPKSAVPGASNTMTVPSFENNSTVFSDMSGTCVQNSSVITPLNIPSGQEQKHFDGLDPSLINPLLLPLLMQTPVHSGQVNPVTECASGIGDVFQKSWSGSSACPPVFAYSLHQTEQMKSKGQTNEQNPTDVADVRGAGDTVCGNQEEVSDYSGMGDRQHNPKLSASPHKIKSTKLWQSSKHKKNIPLKLKRKMELNKKVQSLLQEIRKTEIVNSEDRGSS